MSKIKIFALGGLNEMGKNMYVVEVNKDIFVFDAGLKYPDDTMLGVDYLIPNFDYLKNNKTRIKGIFVTHGHDEQMGAICDILEFLPKIKVYGTKFTLDVIKKEMQESNQDYKKYNLMEIKPHQKISFRENSIFPISLTHDVPEAVGYVLNTKDGSIVYTSNFVFDSTMQTYYKTDIGKLAYIGKQNVLCLLSESIYATKEGFTAPSNRTYDLLKSTINKYDKRILYNVFQHQLYRIQELFDALIQTHRNIVVLGKALEKLIYDSIDNGYLKFDKERILPLSHINDNNIVVIISDEREKAFSNLKRIVKGYDKFLKLTSEDTLVFASPIYDGLEKDSTKLFDDVSKIGCNLVIVSKKYKSFHASIEDLMMMINLMQPKYYFPVIGEYRHQVANKELALKLNMNEENILLKLNGQVVYFENGVLKDNNEIIPTSDILIDGNTSSDIGELVIKDREMLADNGIVVVVATLDKKTKQILAGPEILTRGFVYVKDNIDLIKESSSLAINVINNNVTNNYVDYNKIRNQIREVLGDYFMDETECRPMILTVIGEV